MPGQHLRMSWSLSRLKRHEQTRAASCVACEPLYIKDNRSALHRLFGAGKWGVSSPVVGEEVDILEVGHGVEALIIENPKKNARLGHPPHPSCHQASAHPGDSLGPRASRTVWNLAECAEGRGTVAIVPLGRVSGG